MATHSRSRNSKSSASRHAAPRPVTEKARAKLIAEAVAAAVATSAASMQNAATAAAQAVVKEFISGPGLTQVITTTVGATLERLGLDTQNADETRKDFVHLRQWREVTQNMRLQASGEATKWAVRAGIAALLIGAGAMIRGHLGN